MDWYRRKKRFALKESCEKGFGKDGADIMQLRRCGRGSQLAGKKVSCQAARNESKNLANFEKKLSKGSWTVETPGATTRAHGERMAFSKRDT